MYLECPLTTTEHTLPHTSKIWSGRESAAVWVYILCASRGPYAGVYTPAGPYTGIHTQLPHRCTLAWTAQAVKLTVS